MTSVPQVAAALRQVLAATPTAQAAASGYCRRRSKFSAAAFVQTTVLGWLAHPAGSLADLTAIAADVGVAISPQGLDQRFSAESAGLLDDVLNAAAAQVVGASAPVAQPVLTRFAAVEVIDSTTVTLPNALAARWASCGGRTATTPTAAVKLTVRLDLCRGQLVGPALSAGRTQDRATILQHAPLVANALRIGDLGFWSLGVLSAMRAQEAHFLSRLPPQTVVHRADTGQRVDLRTLLADGTGADLAVELGVPERLPARLLAVPVAAPVAADRRTRLRERARAKGQPPSPISLDRADWTLLVTSAPVTLLTRAEAAALYRARWQIELLFKRWKRDGKLAIWRTRNPHRIRCELLAKLIAVVIQQWLLVTGDWGRPNYSLDRAAAVVRSHAPLLALTLRDPPLLRRALHTLRRILATTPPITKRRARPATFQRLLDPRLALA